MNKKFLLFVAVIAGVAAAVAAVSAFAFNTDTPAQTATRTRQSPPAEQAAFPPANRAQNPAAALMFSLLFDENGEPVSGEILEANLNRAVEAGYIDGKDKAALTEMLESCISGGGADGQRGGFGGCPMMGR